MARRTRVIVLVGIVAALIVAVLVIQVATGGEGSSGIRGVVVSGCVQPPPPLPACPERPLSAAQRVRRVGGGPEPVAEFRSDEDGSFEVELPPGNYVIEPRSNQGFVGRLQPTEVSVQSSEFTRVRLFYDTGIR